MTIFQNDRLYSGVEMYLYCGKKMYTEDTLRINGIIAGRKELIEYVLNSPYSLKKYNSYCISPYALLDKYIMENLVHSVTSYFNTREYSASNVERLQLKILNDFERFGRAHSGYISFTTSGYISFTLCDKGDM